MEQKNYLNPLSAEDINRAAARQYLENRPLQVYEIENGTVVPPVRSRLLRALYNPCDAIWGAGGGI